MMLSDVRDYIGSLTLAEHVYSGKMDGKKEKSIGVYSSRHSHAYSTALGGRSLESYGTSYVTLLVHWNKSQRETEKAANALFDTVCGAREVTVNGQQIKFMQPLVSGPVDVGTDDAGIYEMVIEAAVIYQRKEAEDVGGEENGCIPGV